MNTETDNKAETINTAAAALVAALAGANSAALDVAAVEKIAGDVMARKFAAVLPGLLEQIKTAANEAAKTAITAGGVRRVEFVPGPDLAAVDLGVQHEKFPELLKLCTIRDMFGFVPNVYLYGGAGSGKSTAARMIAKALGLSFYATGALYSKYDLLGLVNAAGEYVESDFFKCFKNGGVFLFDEIDISDPRAVKCFAQALANGHMSFPLGKNGGGVIARHKDCIIIAGGNTDMRGGGSGQGFGTGIKQDAAIRDRFIFINWEIDSKLENGLAAAYGDIGRDWCAKVQKMRENAAAAGIKDFEITPRATINGCALLAAGVPLASVVASCVRKGVNDSAWGKISAGVDGLEG